MAELIGCYVYIDGQYVRSELRQADQSDEFDTRKPASLVQNQRIGGATLVVSRVFYYDAIDEKAQEEEQEQQKQYFARLRRLPDTHVVLGEVRRTRKREQKGVDVQMAVDALRAATSGVIRAIALVTGDADFAPLARAIREAGPHVLVMAFERSLSQSLASEADRVDFYDFPPGDWRLTT